MMAGLIGLAGVVTSFYVFMDYGGKPAIYSLVATLFLVAITVKQGEPEQGSARKR